MTTSIYKRRNKAMYKKYSLTWWYKSGQLCKAQDKACGIVRVCPNRAAQVLSQLAFRIGYWAA